VAAAGEHRAVSADASAPDGTAVRVALWRALHVEADPPPHVLTDEVGLRLVQPDPGWRDRPDMDLHATAGFRASIVARARFLDDLVVDRAAAGVGQYVILGSGLDTFAQRHPELVESLRIYEVDQPGTQQWKRRRITEEGYPLPPGLRFVPVDFESGESWWDALTGNGFDAASPALVSSAGVSMYLGRAATDATLRQVAALAVGSVLAMTYLLPLELVDDAERSMQADVEAAARASGTPFVSHYSPEDMADACMAAGFSTIRHVTPAELTERYFAGRTDGLRPPSAEHMVVAEV
jgi:methyltransferase (TIGR00027 family)